MKVCDYISWYTKSERRVDESGGKTNDEYGGQIEVLACNALFFCSRRVYEPPPTYLQVCKVYVPDRLFSRLRVADAHTTSSSLDQLVKCSSSI